MSDTTEPTTTEGQPTTPTPAVEPTATDGGRDYEAEIVKLRSEAAKWRTQFRDAQGELKDLKPKAAQFDELQLAQKTEAEKTAEKLAQLQQELAQQQAAATAATQQAQLAKLALSVGGVDADVLNLIDVSKLDFDDAEGIKATLAKLSKKTLNGGGPSNPPSNGKPTAPDESELINQYFRPAGRGVGKLFGG